MPVPKLNITELKKLQISELTLMVDNLTYEYAAFIHEDFFSLETRECRESITIIQDIIDEKVDNGEL